MNKNVAIYLRLSKEDEKDGLSESIISQKKLINEFITRDKELSTYNKLEFVDDGYSGYNLNRPAITELIEEVKNNNIGCIIVKDISRFGRNNLEVLPYIEKIFPFMGVRFISVLENLDTSKNISTNTAMDISVKSMMNDFYVKDLSKKRKAVSRMSAEKGIYTSGAPAFGYRTDKVNKKKIVIDEEPAAIVRRIFNYAVEGKSVGEIAKILNADKTFTPIKYRRENVFKKENDKEYNGKGWTNETVKRILKNEVYVGTFIAYKRLHIKIKSNQTIANDEENWVKVENNHEPIIDRKTFDYLQDNYFTNQKRKSPKIEGMFARKVFCGHCGKTMRNTDRNKKYFRCVTHNFNGAEPCIGSSIPKELVEKLILKKLKEEVSRKQIVVKKQGVSKASEKVSIKSINAEIQKLKIESKNIFEKFVNGAITQAEFSAQTENIQSQIELLESDCNVTEGEKRVLNRKVVLDEVGNDINISEADDAKDIYQLILSIEVLTSDMMEFVKSIQISSVDNIEIEIEIC